MGNVRSCSCGYSFDEGVLYKTGGLCPKCKKLISKTIKEEMTE